MFPKRSKWQAGSPIAILYASSRLDSVVTRLEWALLEPQLPGREGSWGGIAQDNRDKGIWEKLLEQLVDAPDFEWLMIDASHIKIHPHAAGSPGGNEAMDKTKGGSTPRYIWPWMRLVYRSESLLRQVPPPIARKLANSSKQSTPIT